MVDAELFDVMLETICVKRMAIFWEEGCEQGKVLAISLSHE